MKDKRNNRGMTMGEVLVVIGIISILAGVAFVSVIRYQRSMAQLERDGIAKEIFVAAQNHLTVAKGQGFSGINEDNCGTLSNEDADEGKGIYYITVNGGVVDPPTSTKMFNLMLPFGAIDETVRTGGSYIIRYQKSTATVMDVFYCSLHGTPARFNHQLSSDEYSRVLGLTGDRKKGDRRNYEVEEDGVTKKAVLGWYGGANVSELINTKFNTPLIQVVNAERLSVLVRDPNKDDKNVSLRLMITGLTSGTTHYVDIYKGDGTRRSVSYQIKNTEDNADPGDGSGTISYDQYEIILDDITDRDGHFCDRSFDDMVGASLNNGFVPGENIQVQAISYSTSALANIAYSSSNTTNSLFASASAVYPAGTVGTAINTAYINNIRHLENLDASISDLQEKTTGLPEGNPGLHISSAIQTNDLIWKDDADSKSFISAIKLQKSITTDDPFVYLHGSDKHTQAGCYMPVNTSMSFDYDGQNHSITGIKVDYAGYAGLFGSPSGLKINNLALIDFDIKATGENPRAGALAGALSSPTVTNVVAFNRNGEDYSGTVSPDIRAAYANGVAGGLIGTVSGGTISYSAAALTVEADAAAGGLIGSFTTGNVGTVTGCYSGGHTDKGEYYTHIASGDRTATNPEIYNIKANNTNSGKAGGLIGDAANAVINISYSTCSVSAKTAGGFVGNASGSIANCYCTGLVSGNEDNAFLGSGSPTLTEDSYYEIVNELVTKDNNGKVTGITYKKPYTVAEGTPITEVTPFDADANKFDQMDGNYKPSGAGTPVFLGQRQDASAYDKDLVKYYNGKYPFKTVCQLWEQNKPDGVAEPDKNYFSGIHYGDWPAPEIFVINSK